MNQEYVITFHTHYEALVCKRNFEKQEFKDGGVLTIKLIPVPRELSSSCGTALRIEVADSFDVGKFNDVEHDEVFKLSGYGVYLSCNV
ncbi:MAG: DUF3343 domain-containing protein [Treponema sp.]